MDVDCHSSRPLLHHPPSPHQHHQDDHQKLSSDSLPEDGGVDLSFDSNMKKESDSESVSDYNAQAKIKMEKIEKCDNIKRCQSPVQQSPGGRLKIFQSK